MWKCMQMLSEQRDFDFSPPFFLASVLLVAGRVQGFRQLKTKYAMWKWRRMKPKPRSFSELKESSLLEVPGHMKARTG